MKSKANKTKIPSLLHTQAVHSSDITCFHSMQVTIYQVRIQIDYVWDMSSSPPVTQLLDSMTQMALRDPHPFCPCPQLCFQ
jgi:hypothetical protein